MANNSPQSGQDSKAGPITFVLVAAILSGIWFAQSPLKSFRQAETSQELLREKEDVQARLWEDPFLAVQKHETEEQKHEEVEINGKKQDQSGFDHHSFIFFKEKLDEKIAQNKSITIVINMVEGGPYAESRESRIRQRYAVVSGLGVQNYVPEESQKIGFFRFFLKRKDGEENENCDRISKKKEINQDVPSKGTCLVVPYEWYKTDPFARLSSGKENEKNIPESPLEAKNVKDKEDSNKSESILVLWIMDEALHYEEPFKDLRNLVTQLRAGLPEGLTNKRLDFKVIGPRTTTTLKSMVKELEKISTDDEKKRLLADLTAVEFFSPWSTSPEWLLTENPTQGTVATLFGGIPFIRTIGTDDQLVEILIQELCRRGVEAGGEDVPITLISEWDTAYGRALPLTFETIVDQMKEEYGSTCRTQNFPYVNLDKYLKLRKGGQDFKANPEKLAQLGIKQYAYLRGLDGELSQENSSKTSNASQESNNLKGLSGKGREISPDIERPEGAMQIDYVRRLTTRIEGELGEGETPVKAIGVLGSDVFDKLLILQALRPRFPNALFFTTDLDARFLHPSQKGWTRNLLVASHYGLKLRKNFQGMVAPFREGYQTAVFRSVLRALCPPTHNSLCDFPEEYGEKEPRFFEIGITMPVDLSEPEGNGTHVHPDLPQPFSLPWEILVLLVIVLMLIGRFLVAGFLEERTWWTMAIFFVVIGFFLWLFLDISRSSDLFYWRGEPFYWFEGVSIWPSQLWRITSAYLCICFFFRIHWELNDKENSQSPQTSGQSENTTKWEKMKLYYEENIPRGGRVVLASILYIFFGLSLMCLVGFPENDGLYRAQVDDTWQRFAVIKGPLFVAVPLLIGLVWQVIEHTLECCHFVRNSIGLSREISEERSFIFEVANRTEKVGRIIYYPVIALILLAVSRFSLFDNWDFPLALVLIIGINFALMLCCAVFLRVSAENVRKITLKSVEENLFKFTVEGNDSKIKCHKFVIDEIKNLRSGAFAPLSQHPIFGAILYPFGGLGVLVLIEYFIT